MTARGGSLGSTIEFLLCCRLRFRDMHYDTNYRLEYPHGYHQVGKRRRLWALDGFLDGWTAAHRSLTTW